MNYSLEFNSSAMGRIQPFEYSYNTTNEYAFTYGRSIFSDLSKFNAPIFVSMKRSVIYYDSCLVKVNKNKELTIFRKQDNVSKGISDLDLFNIGNLANDNKDNELNISYDNIFAGKDFYASIFKEILTWKDKNYANIFDYYFGKEYIPKKITIVNNMKTLNKDFVLEKYDNYFLRSYDNKLNIYQNTSLKKYDNILNVYNTISLSNSDNILSVYDNYMMSKINSDKVNVYDNYFVKKPINKVYLNNVYSVKKPINKLYLNKNFMVKKDINKLFVYETIGVSPVTDRLDINLYEQITAKDKYVLSTNIYDIYVLKQNNAKQIHIDNVLSAKELYAHEIYLNDYMYGTRENRKVMQYDIPDLMLQEFRQSVFVNQENIFLSKDKHGFIINNTEYFTNSSRDKISFEIKDDIESLYRDRYEFIILNQNSSMYRDRYGFRINDTEQFLERDRYGFVFDDYTESIYRDRYSMTISVTETDLTRLEVPLGIISHTNTIGFIIPERKTRLDNNNLFIQTKHRNVFTDDTNEFLEKEKRRTGLNLNNMFIITEQRRTFLDYYHNIMVSKNTKTCLIEMANELIEKVPKNAIIYNNDIGIIKNTKKAFIRTDISIIKKEKDLLKNNSDVFVSKKIKNTFLLNTEIYLDKLFKKTNLTDSIWINKGSHMTDMFDYSFMSETAYEAFVVDNNIFINKAEKGLMNIEDKDITIIKERNAINIDNYIFITKEQYETNSFVSEITHMQKVIKDLEKPVEKTYNWAYVYQYEDPIDPNYDYYGLDELLLPEKDVDYSSFEDVIFDKETMTPRKPIKIIDDNTFIAKYPVKHPTPNYEEIGIVYIDVPSELMYAIFIKFYQIWYANIFKFGNMSMVDSLKLMLEYMYAHIITTYSGSIYLEPALRVFRQIRWFGETSVMHNAQYKITCEYQDLKSNLQTGECMIKNQLSGFYVDKGLKVLSTEPTSIGQEAYIKLYASNREDSQISFSVSLTGGSVEVYINKMHVDTIYSNHAYISYDLFGTDTENEILLRRSANNNIGNCYIGNIIIKKGTYKNLNIEYDPELKAGNMPLNDIVNKMVILANLYEDEQKAFEQFREGNLAVSELYKRLENYWELHHANKIKGKRLTIKET